MGLWKDSVWRNCPGVLYIGEDISSDKLKEISSLWMDKIPFIYVIATYGHSPHTSKTIKISKNVVMLPKHMSGENVGSGDAILYSIDKIEKERFVLIFYDTQYSHEMLKKIKLNDENNFVVMNGGKVVCLFVSKDDFINAVEQEQGSGMCDLCDAIPNIKNLKLLNVSDEIEVVE